MATVYLAHDLKHERPVALKVLHPRSGAGSEVPRVSFPWPPSTTPRNLC